MEQSTSSTAPGVFIASAAVSVLSTGAALVLLIARRKLYPIFGRELWLIIPNGIAGLIVSLHFSLAPILEYSCGFVLVAEVNMPLISMTLWSLRLIRYCFLYFAAQERFARVKDPKASQWFNEHKHWVSTRRLLCVFCLSTVIFVTSASLSYYLSPTLVANGCGDGVLNESLAVVNAAIAINVVILMYTAYRIRTIVDGFFIKTELLYAVIAAVPAGLVFVLHGRVARTLDFALTSFLVVVFIQILQAVFLWYPVIRSYRYQMWLEEQQTSASRNHDNPLIDMLTNESRANDLQDFEEHLVRELNFENYELWRKADEFPIFAARASSLEVAQRAMSIYHEYIKVRSSSEANVSSASRQAVIAELRSGISNFDDDPENSDLLLSDVPLNIDIFDDIKRSMYTLLSRDPYVRWQLLQTQKLVEPVRELERNPEKVWSVNQTPRQGPSKSIMGAQSGSNSGLELSPRTTQMGGHLLVSLDADAMADIAAFQNPGQSSPTNEKSPSECPMLPAEEIDSSHASSQAQDDASNEETEGQTPTISKRASNVSV